MKKPSPKLSKAELSDLVSVNFPGLKYAGRSKPAKTAPPAAMEFRGVPVRDREREAHGHAMKAVPVAPKRKGGK